MEIFWGNDDINAAHLERAVVTIGNFDGCHAGHREIFRRTREHARRIDGVAVVYTFNPHPASVIQGNTPQLLFSINEKVAAIEACGMDVLIVVPFTREFADMSPERFVDEIILGRIRARGVVVGHDFCFGRRATGDIALLQAIGAREGFFVETVAPVLYADTVVSSTCLRRMVAAGDVSGAARLLPHPFRLHGAVVHGMSRGRTIGYPTANIQPDKALIPAYGVYAVRVLVAGGWYDGVANIGDNPTFGDEGTSIEVFIFNLHQDLYGADLTVEFVERLREEIRFQDKDQLVRQIEQDCRTAQTILSRTP